MAEVIWSDDATGLRIATLAYGGGTFGQKSAEKLDLAFKMYGAGCCPHIRFSGTASLCSDTEQTTYSEAFSYTETIN